jgi:hypothetical protein
MSLPSENVIKQFETLDREAKSKIIKAKLAALSKVLEAERPKLTRLEDLVDVALKDPSLMSMLTKRGKQGEVRIKKEVASLYNLNDSEFKQLEKILITKLTEAGIMKIQTQEVKA